MRIQKYKLDTTITEGDMVIGTDETTKRTKNFRLKDIFKLLSINSDISITKQGLKNYIKTSYFDNLRKGQLPTGWHIINSAFKGVVYDFETDMFGVKVDLTQTSGTAVELQLNEKLIITETYSFYSMVQVTEPTVISVILGNDVIKEIEITDVNKWHIIEAIAAREDDNIQPEFETKTIKIGYDEGQIGSSLYIIKPTLIKGSIFTDWSPSFQDIKSKVKPILTVPQDIIDIRDRNVGDEFLLVNDKGEFHNYILQGGIEVENLVRVTPTHFGEVTEVPDELIKGDRFVLTLKTPELDVGTYYYDGEDIKQETGVGGGKHNELEEIQGGKPATETEEAEYYHLNQNQYDSLVGMLYKPKTISFGVSPSNGEKGVTTALTLNYNITANDDLIVSASINQGIGDVALMSGSVSGGTKKATTSYILTINYKDNLDIDKISNHTTSYNAYVPQWYGFHKNDDIITYADLSSYLTKVIQSSSTIQQSVSPANDYIYFVVTKANAKIFDQNNFEQTVGTWGDGVSEFYKKSIIVTLQDNTTETLFVYRTRNTKTITQPFIYKIQ